MKTNTKRITHYIMALVSIVVLVLLDQITKHLVVLHLKVCCKINVYSFISVYF